LVDYEDVMTLIEGGILAIHAEMSASEYVED
jgi:hypothetical protein